MSPSRPSPDRRFRLGALAVVLVAFGHTSAQAYVDPGIMATLYQVGYVLVFGILTGLVVRPFRFVKQTFARVKQIFKPAAEEDIPPRSDAAS